MTMCCMWPLVRSSAVCANVRYHWRTLTLVIGSKARCQCQSQSVPLPLLSSHSRSFSQRPTTRPLQRRLQLREHGLPVREDKWVWIEKIIRAASLDELEAAMRIFRKIIRHEHLNRAAIVHQTQAFESSPKLSLGPFLQPSSWLIKRTFDAVSTMPYDYYLMIVHYLRFNNVDEALEVFREVRHHMPESVLHPSVSMLLIRQCLLVGYLSEAKLLMEDLLIARPHYQAPLKSRLISLIIAPHSKQNLAVLRCPTDSPWIGTMSRWSDDLQVFVNLQLVMPDNQLIDAKHWETIIRMLIGVSQYSEARSLYSLMVQQQMVPSRRIYHLIMRSIFDWPSDRPVPVDTGAASKSALSLVTQTAMVSASNNGSNDNHSDANDSDGDPDVDSDPDFARPHYELSAEEIQISKMKLLSLLQGMKLHQLALTNSMFKIVFFACVRANDINNSIDLLAFLDNTNGSNTQFLINRALNLVAIADSNDRAMLLLHSLLRMKLPLDAEFDTQLIKESSKSNSFHLLLAFLDHLLTVGEEPRALSLLVLALEHCAYSGAVASSDLLFYDFFRGDRLRFITTAHYHYNLLAACVAGNVKIAHQKLITMKNSPRVAIQPQDCFAIIAACDTHRDTATATISQSDEMHLRSIELYSLQLASELKFLFTSKGELNLMNEDNKRNVVERVRLAMRYLWREHLITRRSRLLPAIFLFNHHAASSGSGTGGDNDIDSEEDVIGLLRDAFPRARIQQHSETKAIRMVVDVKEINDWKASSEHSEPAPATAIAAPSVLYSV